MKGNPATQFKSGREASENGRKGGIASGKAKRCMKEAKELALIMLSSMETNKGAKEAMKGLQCDEDSQSARATIIARLIVKAKNGDPKAAEFLFKLTGELTQKQEIEFKGTPTWYERNPFDDEDDSVQKDNSVDK